MITQGWIGFSKSFILLIEIKTSRWCKPNLITFYWGLLHILVSILSIDSISREVFEYVQITLDRSLLWIKPNSKKFLIWFLIWLLI